MSSARMSSRLVTPLVLAVLLSFAPAPARSGTPFVDGTWSALDGAAPAPGARRQFAAIYDHAHHRYLIFAGFSNVDVSYQLFNEVWTLSLGPTPTWTHHVIAGPLPGERHSPQWGYDPARQRLLVFGGYGSHVPGSPWAYLDDIWELSLDGTPAWTELAPSGTPPSGRLAGAAVYDPFRQRFVGFGGTIGVPVDTWVLDFSTDPPSWSTMPTGGVSPPGGYGMTGIFDPIADRMVIFGGSTSDAYYGVHNDTWELGLRSAAPTWHELTPGGPLPIARRNAASIFDPFRYRMVVFGGWDGGETSAAFRNDTWALSLSPPADGQWTPLSPDGETPVGRNAMDAAYDPVADRMVVFGGFSGLVMLGDTRFLSWGGAGTAASMSAAAEAEPTVARVTWSVANATGTRGGVYRRQLDTPWSSLGTVDAVIPGEFAFEDATVTPGARYGYQIVVPSELGLEFGGEVWVDVPSVADVPLGQRTFGLASVNPVVDRFVVSFALPAAAPASLEILDLAGRRVLAREVGSFGVGSHRLDVGGARDFTAGVYFVRLTQSGESRIARVAITGGD